MNELCCCRNLVSLKTRAKFGDSQVFLIIISNMFNPTLQQNLNNK